MTAPLSLPVFDNSAMDGYAVRAEDVASATAEHPVKLPVAEDIPAGRTDTLTLAPGTAHRIMTGARCRRVRRPWCRWKTPTRAPRPWRSTPPPAKAATSGGRVRTSPRAPQCCAPGKWSPRR
ncbi:molybdenum cofactor biosynthesis moeA family protein [Mycobacterium xenopi 3993]|nr:molybdenum cofactor biosynthesis moeA family protein [Mycobacterium xenopi 3993]